MYLSDLASRLQILYQGKEIIFHGVSIDSRNIKPVGLFVAIAGESHDRHDFIDMAAQNGAVAAVIGREMNCAIPSLVVPDTRVALGQLASMHRDHFSLPVLAITGSSGKTTVKEMTAAILRQMGSVLANQSSFNNDIGVPLTLLQLNGTHNYLVQELGTNHPGEIAYTSQLVRPNVALINNASAAHTEFLGDVAGVAAAKAEIFQGLQMRGTAILNADDAFFDCWRRDLPAGTRCLSFAGQAPADFNAKALQIDGKGCASFTLKSPLGEIAVNLAVPGKHNVLNALAAAATAMAAGASLVAIKTGLENVPTVSGRLLARQGKAASRIIDDSYNANPASVKAALALLAELQGKRIFVLGDMAELGNKTHEYHQEVGSAAKKLGIDALYTYGELSAQASKAFGKNSQHFNDQESLIANLLPQLNEQVTVLVKGSRSAKMEHVAAALSSEDSRQKTEDSVGL